MEICDIVEGAIFCEVKTRISDFMRTGHIYEDSGTRYLKYGLNVKSRR